MPRKFRILIILAGAAVVGPLVIALSLPNDEKRPTGKNAFRRISGWADNFAVTLGLKAPKRAACCACVTNGVIPTWALESRRLTNELPLAGMEGLTNDLQTGMPQPGVDAPPHQP